MHASVDKRRQVRDELDAAKLFVVDVIQGKSGLTESKQHGIVLNISDGGIAVQPFRPLANDAEVEINWSPPGRYSVSLGRGSVAWQGSGGRTGLRFVDSPVADRNRLKKFLRSTSAEAGSTEPLSACAVNSETTEWESALQLVAYSAMVATAADGAAIALKTDQATLCRASVGSAPPIGTEVRPDGGLSGHCLRTGDAILCDDTWTDSRLDNLAAMQHETRSVAIVPISLTSDSAVNIIGLLEVFSSRPHAFQSRHLDQLKPLAAVIAKANGAEGTSRETTSVAGTALDANLQETKVEEPVPGVDASLKPANVEEEEPAQPVAVFTDYSKTEGPFLLDVSDDVRASKQLLMFGAVGVVIALILLMVFLSLVAMFSSRSARKNAQQSATASSNGISEKTQPVGALPAISFYPATVVRRVGKSFAISLIVKGAKNISSVPLQIQYDPDKLQVLKVLNGDLLGRDGQAATLVHREDKVTGTIHVTVSRPPLAPAISGNGVLLTLAFIAKAPGQSRLRLSQAGEAASHASEAVINISSAPTAALERRRAVRISHLELNSRKMKSG